MNRVVIKQGRLLDPTQQRDEVTDLYLADGVVVGLGAAPAAGFSAELTIDASNHLVLPGLIDLAVSLHVPSSERANTITSETRAAAKGGITSLCTPPDMYPIIDSPATVESIQQLARQAGFANVFCIGALTQGLTGEQLAEMVALQEAGCIAMSNGARAITNTAVLRRSFEYAASFAIPVIICPQDAWLTQGKCAHEGMVSTRLGLPGIPAVAESIDIARCLEVAELTGVQLHFSRISSARSVALIADAQARGLAVSADVAIHHLYLSEIDTSDYDTRCRVYPPLRSMRDRDALRRGVQEGVITTICSDHQPRKTDDKQLPFPEALPGISGLETLFSLVWRLREELGMTALQVLQTVTQAPAELFNLSAGSLQIGQRADVCIVDPAARYVVEPEQFFSRGRNTAFAGWELPAQVSKTLLEGRVVYAHHP